MLFDLQSRGRRTVVKVVYGGLALLLGGGLLLFGVGTGTGGNGFFDLFKNGGTAPTSQVSAAEKRADRAVRVNPKNAAAWAALARYRYQDAGFGGNYDQQQQTFTESGKDELGRAIQAWQRYLALKPEHPDPNLARLMSIAYSTGLNDPASAASTFEIVTNAQPNAANFGQLAQLAYTAGQIRKGDLASAKAVALAPKAQRAGVKRQLATAKRTAVKQQVQRAAGGAGATTTPGSVPPPNG
jgi:hypothetical protein